MSHQLRSFSHRRRIAGDSYIDKILGLGPVAYWPLDEASGSTAACRVNSAQNGSVVGVTWANDETGVFGTPAPYFDGANDYIDATTATLTAAWDAGGAEWTILHWLKVANAGVWTDGQNRLTINYFDAAPDRGLIKRSSTNNWISFLNVGGSVVEGANVTGLSTTDWVLIAMTRSESADEVRYYWDGAYVGMDTGIGTWGSSTPWVSIILGASDTVPGQVWHGWLAHYALFPHALGAPQITALANP